MFRYENEGNTVSVLLRNGYKIIATSKWITGTNKYSIRFCITYLGTGLIQFMNRIELESEREQLKCAIATFITDKYHEGYFNSYIEKYDYMIKCFDEGNSVLENERDS